MSHRHFPFVVLEIAAENLQRAGTFYSALFGWSFAQSDTAAGALEAQLDGDDDTIVRVHLRSHAAGSAPALADGHPAGGSHSLCVHDLAPVLAGIVAAGGQLIAGPVDVPGVGRRLHVRDTEGNEVAILEPSHPQH